ncbi:hypothetical protein D1872_303220 [compost metagenome]
MPDDINQPNTTQRQEFAGRLIVCSQQRLRSELLQDHNIIRHEAMTTTDKGMGRLTLADAGLTSKQDADARDIDAYAVDCHFRS